MQSPGAPHPARPKLTGRNTIRTRLTWLLTVPLIAVLLLLGDLVLKETDEYAAANAASASTHLGQVAQGLVHALQRERGLATGVLGGFASYRADLDAARAAE